MKLTQWRERRKDAIIALLFPLSLPSFPRKRESRRFQPSPLPEIMYKLPTADSLSLYGLAGAGLAFRNSGEYSNLADTAVDRASLSESGFSGLAGFSGFHFARLAFFAITGNPANTNTNKRLPVKDEMVES